MTLTTHIRIVEPTPAKPIFDECRRILGGESVPFTYEQDKYGPEPHNWSYRNGPGQGLHALLWVEHGADGPLSDYAGTEGEDCTYWYGCELPGHRCPPKASIAVAFDTTYTYRNKHGGGCGDLHAWLILTLGKWLNDKGLTWLWENEFTGEWFPSTTSPDGILGNPAIGTPE